jgi:DNA repair exonuclease SbcCD ATPase subunit
MSEVLEVSPRQQDYKQGIKWEIRMLVKREDVFLATDDMLSRKDWVDSLTSIMGKVSIATQNELTSRIHSSEQMNRDLQGVAEELDAENTQLKEQIQALTESAAKKDRFYQQELQNREAELKEALAKKERHFQQELQEREEELNTEMDRQRQALETKCEIFEREAIQWRSKYSELEKKGKMTGGHMDFDGKYQAKIESLEIEVRKWRNRVDELEHHQKQMDYRKSSTHDNYKTRSIVSGDFDSNDTLKETLSDVKFNLQVLRDQIKTSSDGPLLDIKTTVSKLCDTLEDAKKSWGELQGDIIKFIESEKQDSDTKDSQQKGMIELLRNDFTDLREELVGVSTNDNEAETTDDKEKKLPSLSEKFDILIEMVENVQISQSRLTSSFMDSNSASGSSSDSSPTTPSLSLVDIKESDLYKAVASQQKQISEWIEESREIQNSTLTTIESNVRQNRSLPSVPSDISRLHEKITNTIEKAMTEIAKNQQQGQEEQGKNIKVIGNYLQLISNDIQESSIPDLSALSQQLEDVVERLNTTEERLSSLNDPTKWSLSTTSTKDDSTSFCNIPTSSASNNMSDDDKLSQLHNFVKNTERFMERSLRILSRYGDNPNGMEETIRRAVKGASKAHLEEIIAIQEQNKDERGNIEKKIQRYEENARTYFDKSMEKMHTDLHEFTGVMYEMLERLVLQALEHSSSAANIAGSEKGGDDQQQKSIQNVIELHGKLSGMNQALKSEIAKLEEEKEELEASVREMKKTSKDMEREIDKRQVELRSIRSEYERVNRDIQRSREEGTSKLAKELEPLFHQISQLKKMASVSNDLSDDNSGDSYVDLGREMKTKVI